MPLLDTCLSDLFEPGNIASASGGTLVFTPPPPAAGSHGFLLDLPLLRRNDEIGNTAGTSFRLYEAVSSEDRSGPPLVSGLSGVLGWYGGALDVATTQLPDGLIDGLSADILVFLQALYQSGQYRSTTHKYGPPFGTATAIASDYAAFRTNWDKSITVQTVGGQPFADLPLAATYQEMIDEATLFAVGAANRWVLGAYQTAVDNGDGTFTFSGLIMGLHGTERFIAQLAVDDAFLYLRYVDLLPVAEQTDLYDPVGRALWPDATFGHYYPFQQTSIGGNLIGAALNVFQQTGNSATPPSPVHLKATVSGSDIVLSWRGRSRFPWHLAGAWDIESSETTDTYDLEIYDGVTLKRTITDNPGQSYTYLAADITTDFGSIPASLRVKVYRKSAHVGRGYPADATLVPGLDAITVANRAPTITSDGGGVSATINVFENATAVTTVTATDPDGTTDLVYSITGGADAAKFAIGALTGILTFVAAPDYETPTDANSDNTYLVTVQASDGDLADTQALSVAVHNVNEAPVITSDGGGSTAAITMYDGATPVTTVVAVDPESAPLTYSISGGDDGALFNIGSSSGALAFNSAPDFNTPLDANSDNYYEVTVEASDGTNTDTQAITVRVTTPSVRDLTASNLAVGSPSLGTPTIGQVHALTASNLEVGSPSLGTPRIPGTPSLDSGTAHSATISGTDNLTATNTGTTGTDQGARIINAAISTGKFYAEFEVVTRNGGGNVGGGIGTDASTYANMGNDATHGAMIFMQSGNLYVDGSFKVTLNGLGILAGERGCICWDEDNHKFWGRYKNNSWNANGSADPAAGTGSYTIPSSCDDMFLVFGGSSGASGNVLRWHLRSTDWSYAAPSGFGEATT